MMEDDREMIERAMRENREVVVVHPMTMPTEIIVDLLAAMDRLHRLYGGGGYRIKSQTEIVVNELPYNQIVMAPDARPWRWFTSLRRKVTVRMRE